MNTDRDKLYKVLCLIVSHVEPKEMREYVIEMLDDWYKNNED